MQNQIEQTSYNPTEEISIIDDSIIKGWNLRRRLSGTLHRYESAVMSATQVGSRGLCASIETYWALQGFYPSHISEYPLKVATWGVWGLTKYFQWLGVFHLYHKFVPESQTAEMYVGVKANIRRLKDNPVEFGIDAIKGITSAGLETGRSVLESMDQGYSIGEVKYSFAGAHPVLMINKEDKV